MKDKRIIYRKKNQEKKIIEYKMKLCDREELVMKVRYRKVIGMEIKVNMNLNISKTEFI